MTLETSALERFLRYVTIDTRADESSKGCPSTPGQRVLMEILADELRALGLSDVVVDEYGYLMASIPATLPEGSAPAIGFIAHVDTSPEVSGAGVRPIVHRGYDGRDIVLPDDTTAVLRVQEDAALAALERAFAPPKKRQPLAML